MTGEATQKTVTIGIETSGPTGSVAVRTDDGRVAERAFQEHLKHAREIVSVLDALMTELDLDRDRIGLIAVSRGPGSYTGVRVGVMAAKALAWALDARTAGVMSLDVLALGAPVRAGARLVVAADAKRRAVYTAAYTPEEDAWRREGDPDIVPPDQLAARLREGDAVVGDGVPLLGALPGGVTTLDETLWTPHADNVVALGLAQTAAGGALDAHALLPLYLRPPKAVERWQERHGAGTDGRTDGGSER